MPRSTIDNRREVLLDTVERLMLDRGFDAVSVQQVATAAGVSKGGVYLEFDSKYAMLDAVLVRATERLVAEVSDRLASHDNPSLGVVYRAGAAALLADPLMSAAALDDRSVLGSHLAETDSARYSARFSWLVDYLSALHTAGRMPGDVDPDAVALALSSFTIGLLSASTVLGPLTARQLADALDVVARLVDAGLVTTATGAEGEGDPVYTLLRQLGDSPRPERSL